ncbi:MAG: hypothetical protein MHM6MM_001835 [Cercozoa sp. M6MM]
MCMRTVLLPLRVEIPDAQQLISGALGQVAVCAVPAEDACTTMSPLEILCPRELSHRSSDCCNTSHTMLLRMHARESLDATFLLSVSCKDTAHDLINKALKRVKSMGKFGVCDVSLVDENAKYVALLHAPSRRSFVYGTRPLSHFALFKEAHWEAMEEDLEPAKQSVVDVVLSFCTVTAWNQFIQEAQQRYRHCDLSSLPILSGSPPNEHSSAQIVEGGDDFCQVHVRLRMERIPANQSLQVRLHTRKSTHSRVLPVQLDIVDDDGVRVATFSQTLRDLCASAAIHFCFSPAVNDAPRRRIVASSLNSENTTEDRVSILRVFDEQGVLQRSEIDFGSFSARIRATHAVRCPRIGESTFVDIVKKVQREERDLGPEEYPNQSDFGRLSQSHRQTRPRHSTFSHAKSLKYSSGPQQIAGAIEARKLARNLCTGGFTDLTPQQRRIVRNERHCIADQYFPLLVMATDPLSHDQREELRALFLEYSSRLWLPSFSPQSLLWLLGPHTTDFPLIRAAVAERVAALPSATVQMLLPSLFNSLRHCDAATHTVPPLARVLLLKGAVSYYSVGAPLIALLRAAVRSGCGSLDRQKNSDVEVGVPSLDRNDCGNDEMFYTVEEHRERLFKQNCLYWLNLLLLSVAPFLADQTANVRVSRLLTSMSITLGTRRDHSTGASTPEGTILINGIDCDTALQALLARYQDLIVPGMASPVDPFTILHSVNTHKSRIMSSKKKPIWLALNAYASFFSEKTETVAHSVIFKKGDDVRQDLLMLHTLQLLRDWVWNESCYVSLYRVTVLSDDSGFIEVVNNAQTLGTIYHEFGCFADDAVHMFLKRHLPNLPESSVWYCVQRRFALSAAAYCVMTKILGIGDRHCDNILVDLEGRLVHIDYGHILGHFKRKLGVLRERTPFMFTSDLLRVTGAHQDRMERVAQRMLRQCRRHASLLVTVLSLALPWQLPELQSDREIDYLRHQLMLPPFCDTDDACEVEQRLCDAFLDELKAATSDRYRRFDNAIHVRKHGDANSSALHGG